MKAGFSSPANGFLFFLTIRLGSSFLTGGAWHGVSLCFLKHTTEQLQSNRNLSIKSPSSFSLKIEKGGEGTTEWGRWGICT
jgi:hypothetical protein